MDVSGRHCKVHVAHGGNPVKVGMDCLSPNSKGDHQHMGYRPARDPVEGGGGADLHPPPCKPPDARRLTRVQCRKRDGYVYNGVEARPRACQHRPSPPLSVIPVPKEVI